MTDVAGKTIFITGGAQGIGLGMARAFALAGADLALADIDADALDAARHELSATARTETFPLDVRDRDAFAQAADDAEARLGPVTVLCNNAGVLGTASVTDPSPAVWDHILGTDLGGVFNGVSVFLPRMIARGSPGHVVNTASTAGVRGGRLFEYSAAKAAVIALSESLHADPDLARLDVRTTVLCPGGVRTRIIDHGIAGMPGGTSERQRTRIDDERMRTVVEQCGLAPEDVGELVLTAVREDRFYVFTDRSAQADLQERASAMLAALPEESEHDRRLAEARRRLGPAQDA
ncbi:SDR family NAD(P)-dependent oxidoreductase [Nocardiopsis baichengensis]|uniref:SDR family NAD(P)-dependent oxidoreductase n=1 Tax=Nocardiopsis baichengensis TaxID=280240 RepID=UPI0003481D2E|nr:SDR family NAD(P)-dependent oxidoreductase [Nocardiopsis baichengensis]